MLRVSQQIWYHNMLTHTNENKWNAKYSTIVFNYQNYRCGSGISNFMLRNFMPSDVNKTIIKGKF